MEQKILIRAERELWSDTISIRLAERVSSGLSVAMPATMRDIQPNEFTEPLLRLDLYAAQRLIDELWNCGLRPSEGTGSAGSLRATEKHLTDMQRIAFMLLEKSTWAIPDAASAPK